MQNQLLPSPLSPTTSLTSAYDNSTNLFSLTFSVMLCMLHRGSLKVAPYQPQAQPITLLLRTTHFPLLAPPLTPAPSMKNLNSDLLTYSSPPSLQVTLSSTNSHHPPPPPSPSMIPMDYEKTLFVQLHKSCVNK